MPLATATLSIQLAQPQLELTAAPNPLPLPWFAQKTEQWCWAACIQMVVAANNAGTQQCDVVNREFGQNICCQDPDNPACNQPLQVWDLVAAWQKWQLGARIITYAVQFNYLTSEVAAGRPVEVGFAFNGGTFHVALAVGTATTSNGDFVRVNDPAYGPGWVSFVNLCNAYNLGTWQWTWDSIGR